MYLGSSLGTALVGSLLIAALTSSLAHGVSSNSAVPQSVKDQASVRMQSVVPFMSDKQLEDGRQAAGVCGSAADAIVDENDEARYDGLRSGLAAVLLVGILGLFLSGGLPARALEAAPR